MMLQGGSMLLAIGLLCGQRLTAMPNAASLAAMGYLTVFSSLIGFSAFTFLLRHTRPAVALSHAYVNPVVAVALGALLNNEPVTRLEIAAVVLISLAVIFLTFERPESPRFDAPAEKAMAEATPASAG